MKVDELVEGMDQLEFIQYANRYPNVIYQYIPEWGVGLMHIKDNNNQPNGTKTKLK